MSAEPQSGTGSAAADPASEDDAEDAESALPGGDPEDLEGWYPDAGDGGEDLEAVAEAVQADIADITAIAAQRDEYLALAQRLQAEFENYRKRATKERDDAQSWGASRLAEQILPVLDACDSALVHGADAVTPIYRTLVDAMTKAGLEIISSDNAPFDPREHDAVMHEEGEAGAEAVVAETLRTGYRWNGRVLRPAMVKVRG
jgi:molecular chaperone GrpE